MNEGQLTVNKASDIRGGLANILMCVAQLLNADVVNRHSL